MLCGCEVRRDDTSGHPVHLSCFAEEVETRRIEGEGRHRYCGTTLIRHYAPVSPAKRARCSMSTPLIGQTQRLPTGGLVDRGVALPFRFDGRDLVGLGGDTLASALLAN